MKQSCQNQLCQNPSAKVVSVSVRGAGDQKRSLCSICEEAYSWGVQHGMFSGRMAAPNIDRFLGRSGFAVITRNGHDPSRHGPYEAWAYTGPLDFEKAGPFTFGVGQSLADAMEALDYQLAARRKRAGRVKHTPPT